MGCSSIYDVSYDYDREADFSNLKTYEWMDIPEGVEIDRSVRARVKNAVDKQLETKGFLMNSEEPDFRIAMHTGTEEKVTYTDWGYSYGSHWYGPAYTKFKYQEGTLLLDFIDARSKKLIWRGEAKGLVEDTISPEKLETLVNDAVQQILKNFPPPPL